MRPHQLFYIFAFHGSVQMTGQPHIARLLFLCFSAFLAHSLIPHHHHAELVIIQPGESCPIKHKDQNHPGDHPSHCHAFNELAFSKPDMPDIDPESRKIQLHPASVNTHTDPEVTVQPVTLCFPVERADQSGHGRGTISPRAPPSPVNPRTA
jgi:hypothetical protein